MVELFLVVQRISEESSKHFVSLVFFLSAYGFPLFVCFLIREISICAFGNF